MVIENINLKNDNFSHARRILFSINSSALEKKTTYFQLAYLFKTLIESDDTIYKEI